MAKKSDTSIHHLLPQNPETTTTYKWSNDPLNIKRIKNTTHDAIHTLFVNKMIANQMLTCVEMSEQALLPEVTAWLVETLTSLDPLDPTLRYKPECIK